VNPVEIANLTNDTRRFVFSLLDCDTETERAGYEEAIRSNDVVCMGMIVLEPVRPPAFLYRTDGRFIRKFYRDKDAFEWNNGFTDGPEIYGLEKYFDGRWRGWTVDGERWATDADIDNANERNADAISYEQGRG
jgi:hypothetical protein